MYTSIVFLALIGTCFAGLVDFHPCKGDINPPQVVSIEGCEGYKCRLTVGQTVNLTVEFVSPVDTDKITVYDQIGTAGVWSYACGKGFDCPVSKGQYYVHHHEIEVTSYGAETAKDIYYRLETSIKKEPMICFTYPIYIE